MEIDGPQLSPIHRILGLNQSTASGLTEIDTDNVTQVLPVVPEIIRRGSTPFNVSGWYEGILENVHSAGDAEASSINPYSPGAGARAPYPAEVPLGFDVWMLGVGGVRSDGAGGLTEAMIQVNPNATQVGWGLDDAGAAVAAVSPSITVARFVTLATTGVGTITDDPMIDDQGNTFVNVRQRIPRGATIEFHSLSAAAAEFQAIFLMGIFPEALGQDVVA